MQTFYKKCTVINVFNRISLTMTALSTQTIAFLNLNSQKIVQITQLLPIHIFHCIHCILLFDEIDVSRAFLNTFVAIKHLFEIYVDDFAV